MAQSILALNAFAANKAPAADFRLAASFGPDIIGVCEGHRFWREMGALPGYRHYHGPPDTGRGGRETNVLMRSGDEFEYLGLMHWRIARPSKPSRVAPARYLTGVHYLHRAQEYFYGEYHLHAAIQSRLTGAPLLRLDRTKKYVESVAAIEDIVSFLHAQGISPIMAGDGNYRQHRGTGLWAHSPEATFKRIGMRYVSTRGLDGLAFGKELELKSLREIPTSRTHSDHSWLHATLERSA